MHAVQPLQEDGAALVGVLRGAMAAADSKLVTESQPLTLHQHLKTLENEERSLLFLIIMSVLTITEKPVTLKATWISIPGHVLLWNKLV